jgi:photosystem II stability/assembly factor-like uncharacterized protein
MKKTLLILTLFMSIAQSIHAQWQPTEGTKGASVKSLVTNGNKLYMANNDGIYVSADNGSNWSRLGNANRLIVNVLAVTATTIYAGGYFGLNTSTDNGATWVRNTTLPVDYVTMIVTKDANLYVGTGEGLYLSTNNGTSWTLLNRDIIYPNSLVFKGLDIYVSTYEGLYSSSNNGISWRTIGGLPSRGVQTIGIKGTKIYAASADDLYVSADDGASWTRVGFYQFISKLLINGENMYAGTNGGVYVSTDGGTTWELRTNGFIKNSIKALAVVGTTVIAGTDGNLHKSTDNGTTWAVSNNGLKDTYFRSLATNGTRSFAATQNGQIYTSADEGANWTQINNAFQSINIASLAMVGNTAFTSALGKVYSTTNNGTTWAESSTGLTGLGGGGITILPSFILLSNGSNLYAGGYGVFSSTNNGTLWTKGINSIQYWSITALASNGSTIYAAGYDPLGDTTTQGNVRFGVFSSTDNGGTWNQILTTDYSIICLSANGRNIYAGTDNGLFLSQNNGNSWTEVNIGVTSPFINSIATKDNTVFVASDRIYYSTNNGQNWRPASEGLPTRTGVSKLVVSGNYLFAGANIGIFRRPLNEFISVGIKNNNDELSYSIFPNPVSNTLIINCSEALIGKNYSIKNILGETIQAAILSNNSTQLNVQNFANGIYFLNLIGTNKTVKFVKE